MSDMLKLKAVLENQYLKPQKRSRVTGSVKGGGGRYNQNIGGQINAGPLTIQGNVSRDPVKTKINAIKAIYEIGKKGAVSGDYKIGNNGTPVYGLGFSYKI